MTVGIYPRKLLFFLSLALLIFGGIKIVPQIGAPKIPSVSASIEDNINLSQTDGVYYLELDLKNDGSIEVGGKRIKEGVKARSDRDEIRYIVLDQPSENYYSGQIVLNLPQKISRLYDDPEVIAVHGALPVSAYLDQEGKKIIYEVSDISNSATVTIVASFPKGYLSLPAAERVTSELGGISGYIWLVGGFALPVIAVLVIMYMFFRSDIRSKRIDPKENAQNAPSSLSPALVSIIVDGTVSPRTLMAMLVDLAYRGYIEIFNRGDDFVIYRKPTNPDTEKGLRTYERIILEKIFLPKQSMTASMDVETRMARHLFSRKIAAVYLALYMEGKHLGYFEDLPARVHLKYRMIGIATFFAGILGFTVFAFIGPDPKFMLFFWLSLVLFGVLIIKMAPRLTTFTKKGRNVQADWLRFKNYLEENDVVRGWDELFLQNLAYSVAFDCEASWAARFVESNFTKPDWYDHINLAGGVENFVKSFWPVIDQIGKSLAVSSEPLVR